MEQWNYENTNTANFISYLILSDQKIDTVALGMMTNNNISGFLPMTFLQADNEKYYKYNITSKISLKLYFEGTVNKKRFLSIISSICKGLELCEEYLLELDSIVLDMEHIFVDVSTSEAYLICLPVLGSSNSVTADVFFKQLLMSTQFDSSENCDYIAKLLNKLNSSSNITFSEIRTMSDKMLADIDDEEEDPVQSVSGISMNNQTENNVNADFTVSHTPSYIPPAPSNNFQSNQVQNTPVINMPPSNNTADSKETVVPQVPQQESKSKESKNGFFSSLMKSNKKHGGGKQKEKKQKQKKSQANFAPGMAIPGTVPNINAQSGVQGVNLSASVVNKSANQPLNPQTAYSEQSKDAESVQSNPAIVRETVQQSVQPFDFQVKSFQNTAAQGQTTVLNKDMLSPDAVPKIYRFKTNELINISKNPFKIGKEISFVDYCISDNSAISRIHATIVKRGTDYFIIDTNSTNHTYLNGSMLQSNVEYKLEENIRIKLANEEFEFRLF